MSRPIPNQPQTMSLDQFQDAGTNIVFMFTSIFTRPLKLVLRPWHGSRYFSPIVIFLSSTLMLLLPAFTATTQAVVGMIPSVRTSPWCRNSISHRWEALFHAVVFPQHQDLSPDDQAGDGAA